MRANDSKERFSSRVSDYVKYRPGYPGEVVELFRGLGLTPDSVVADVGSGTGISAELFLKEGCVVFCVEPNDAMRLAAEERLGTYAGFRSVKGAAEATGLPDSSMDFIVCAQAFHWFDQTKARAEFARIGKEGARVVLMWNERKKEGSAFLEGYESLLLVYGTDYRKVDHVNIPEHEIAAFFGGTLEVRRFENFQELDLEGLQGRVFSSSYTPRVGEEGREALESGLEDLFELTNDRGKVKVEYETEVYLGRIQKALSL
jgi:SAM-dependent methyltransferase